MQKNWNIYIIHLFVYNLAGKKSWICAQQGQGKGSNQCIRVSYNAVDCTCSRVNSTIYCYYQCEVWISFSTMFYT